MTKAMIKTKEHAKQFLLEYAELDFPYESFWFRFDGDGYTILHETEGIIGATEKQAIDYVYRHRKQINLWLNDEAGEVEGFGTFRPDSLSMKQERRAAYDRKNRIA